MHSMLHVGATPGRPAASIHPLIARVTHWINAVAMVVMIMSGLAIHNAHPILPTVVPAALTLGGWLGGAIRWHFAAMWLLAGNGLIYLAYGILAGRFRRKLLPISLHQAAVDVRAGLTGRLGHQDLSVYNAVQRLLYVVVILAGVLAVLSGLAIWKPVQFGSLTALMGDFDNARIVHFLAMTTIVLFLVVHVVMALLVPRSLKAMIVGR
jgi:thiosulfate reductase cytochrome b subunit